jgi:conjugal transfer mating pair stabilization protein TraG
LLAGYSSPIYRQLDQHETRLAEAAGYQLLGDAWNAPKPDGQSPAKNAGLSGQAHEFGEVRSKAGETAFHDPRNEAGGLGEQVIGRIQKAENRVDGGGGAVNAAYQRALQDLKGSAIFI